MAVNLPLNYVSNKKNKLAYPPSKSAKVESTSPLKITNVMANQIKTRVVGKSISVKSGGEDKSLDIADISYFEINGNEIELYFNKSSNLKIVFVNNTESKNGFIRINQIMNGANI